jgi:hypothetical protein
MTISQIYIIHKENKENLLLERPIAVETRLNYDLVRMTRTL